ncbi:hypothetical protein N657DRAFT_719250 [Parathielavia appendiculata]|uniref:Uncharacterized protein n=1 Tax=Parathielavia appendiculata TaxID=2587402 RepID=A0AAN6TPJ6_9PEZI|nr:hypothetical protein N657DRAFT_719250 [Parathielavia appendiculata]
MAKSLRFDQSTMLENSPTRYPSFSCPSFVGCRLCKSQHPRRWSSRTETAKARTIRQESRNSIAKQVECVAPPLQKHREEIDIALEVVRGRIAKKEVDGRRPGGSGELRGVGLVDQQLSEEQAQDEIGGLALVPHGLPRRGRVQETAQSSRASQPCEPPCPASLVS